jgi:hypothetical protein
MADAFPKSPGRLVSPSGIPHLIEADVTPIAFFQSILIDELNDIGMNEGSYVI